MTGLTTLVALLDRTLCLQIRNDGIVSGKLGLVFSNQVLVVPLRGVLSTKRLDSGIFQKLRVSWDVF